MNCGVISLGRSEPCKDVVGGLKAMYFIQYDSTINSTYLLNINGEIASFENLLVLYKYDLKGTNSFDEVSNSSRELGTNFWTQNGEMNLKKMDLFLSDALNNFTVGRYHILIEDNNGNLRFSGIEFGCEINAEVTSGTSMLDFQGAKLSFEAMEKKNSIFMSSSILDDKINTYVVTDAASALGLKEWWKHNALDWNTIEDNWNEI